MRPHGPHASAVKRNEIELSRRATHQHAFERGAAIYCQIYTKTSSRKIRLSSLLQGGAHRATTRHRNHTRVMPECHGEVLNIGEGHPPHCENRVFGQGRARLGSHSGVEAHHAHQGHPKGGFRMFTQLEAMRAIDSDVENPTSEGRKMSSDEPLA